MLTDAEMQRLLDQHARYNEYLPRAVCLEPGDDRSYLLALDAALPKLVEEVRRLRIEWAEGNAMWVGEHPGAEKLAYYERMMSYEAKGDDHLRGRGGDDKLSPRHMDVC